MALGADSVVTHRSVTKLTWPTATGSSNRGPAAFVLLSHHCLSSTSARLLVSPVSPLWRSASQLVSPTICTAGSEVATSGVEKGRLEGKVPCSLGKQLP